MGRVIRYPLNHYSLCSRIHKFSPCVPQTRCPESTRSKCLVTNSWSRNRDCGSSNKILILDDQPLRLMYPLALTPETHIFNSLNSPSTPISRSEYVTGSLGDSLASLGLAINLDGRIRLEPIETPLSHIRLRGYPLCLPILGLRTNHCSHQKRTSGTTHGQGDLNRAPRVTIADLRSIAQSIGSLRPSDDLLHLTLKFQEILIILEVRWSWGNCRILSCMRG